MPADAVIPPRRADESPALHFSVWSEPAPPPGRFGIARYPAVLLEIFLHLPNLELFRERRLHEPGPVHVRFQV